MRVIFTVGVAIIVAIVLELLGNILRTGEGSEVGTFLVNNNILLGFLAGLVYYFWGPSDDYRFRR